MGVRSIALLLAATALIACNGEDQRTATTTVPLTVTTTLAEASELAPSQVAASTVPEPELPPPCDVGELQFSTPADLTIEGVGAVIRIRNGGDVRCEVDVIDSPAADPLMEPDVWIDPGTEAELLVDQSASTCAQPGPVTSVDLVVNGTPVTIPVTIAETCGVTLTAIYAVEPVA